MKWSINSLTPFAGTSLILVVTLWPIFCFCFVRNSMDLMGFTMLTARSDVPELSVFAITLFIVKPIILMIFEGVMIGLLIIQALSSLDHLNGQGNEYARNWKDCHRKVLIGNTIVLVGSIFLLLCFMKYNMCLYEFSAVSINFMFVLTASSVQIDEDGDINGVKNGISMIGQTSGNQQRTIRSPVSSPVGMNNMLNANIRSFLENDYVSEKDMKSAQKLGPALV